MRVMGLQEERSVVLSHTENRARKDQLSNLPLLRWHRRSPSDDDFGFSQSGGIASVRDPSSFAVIPAPSSSLLRWKCIQEIKYLPIPAIQPKRLELTLALEIRLEMRRAAVRHA